MPSETRELAERIKATVREATGLSCSAINGIGPKATAKLDSFNIWTGSRAFWGYARDPWSGRRRGRPAPRKRITLSGAQWASSKASIPNAPLARAATGSRAYPRIH
ncbi:hypothetical protein [Holophaga foetida]|uniref:hypothetical protein n=1 Tax=Holophaga foetida TaxID=35839 RepID=UPI003CC71F45